MKKNDHVARLSLPRTPLGTVTNAARPSSPVAKPKAAASQLDSRLSSLCANLQGNACAEVLALLKGADELSAARADLLRAGLRTLLDNQRLQGPLPARFRSNEGPVERLLTHVLSKCGESFGELLEPACVLLCAQPEPALTESFKSIALHGHPAVAEGALQRAQPEPEPLAPSQPLALNGTQILGLNPHPNPNPGVLRFLLARAGSPEPSDAAVQVRVGVGVGVGVGIRVPCRARVPRTLRKRSQSGHPTLIQSGYPSPSRSRSPGPSHSAGGCRGVHRARAERVAGRRAPPRLRPGATRFWVRAWARARRRNLTRTLTLTLLLTLTPT